MNFLLIFFVSLPLPFPQPGPLSPPFFFAWYYSSCSCILRASPPIWTPGTGYFEPERCPYRSKRKADMIRISTPNKVISRVCYDEIPMRYTQCYEVHIPCRVRSDCEFNEDAKPCNILVKVQLRVPQIQKGSIHSALVSFGEFLSGKLRSGILRYQITSMKVRNWKQKRRKAK